MKARLGILVVLGIALLPPAVFGQITTTLSGGPAKAEKPESERSLPIVLHPAALPTPSLKYQLLPPFPHAGRAMRRFGGTGSPPNRRTS